jgi:hypothetical protein
LQRRSIDEGQYSTQPKYYPTVEPTRKGKQVAMFDAECNTYIKMKDLDILMNMKSQAHQTIATLEKAYEKYNAPYITTTESRSIGRNYKQIKITEKPLNLLTPRGKSPEQLFDLRQD